MKKVKNTNEKICAFYASDYHFEMISLPYIEKKLEKQNEVVILTESNLEETVQNLVSKINLNKNKKTNILNLNWKNEDSKKLEKIEKNINENKEQTIFIKGKEKYIKNINTDIEKIIKQASKIKIINCYDIEEVGENLEDIMAQYKKVLSTNGEKEIEKL